MMLYRFLRYRNQSVEVINRIFFDGCIKVVVKIMATCSIRPGIPVILKELEEGSQFFHQGASLRVTGKLQEYSVDTAIAVITEDDVSFKIDTQHLRDLTFKIGSYYQFIGELLILPEDSAILQARVGRNVDGLDINLYHRSLELRRQFEVELMNSRVT